MKRCFRNAIADFEKNYCTSNQISNTLSISALLTCNLPAKIGTCASKEIRWHYNAAKKICETFKYSGCGGNANNFGTREECEAFCSGVGKEAIKDVCPNGSTHLGPCIGELCPFGFECVNSHCCSGKLDRQKFFFRIMVLLNY